MKILPGSKVGIVSPSKSVTPENISRGLAYLRSLGYEPVLGRHVFDRYRYMAGTPQDRAEDLMTFYRNPEIKAIFSTAGGDGSQMVAPFLDYKIIKENLAVMGADARGAVLVHQTAGGRIPAQLHRLMVQLHHLTGMLGRHGANHGRRSARLFRLRLRGGSRCRGFLFPQQHHGNHRNHHNRSSNAHIEHGIALGVLIHGIGDAVALQNGQDLADAHRIEEVLIQVGGCGIDPQHCAAAVHQGASGVTAAHGGVGLNEAAPGAALGKETADAAGGHSGVLLAERVHRLNGNVCRQRITHSVDLTAQHGVLGLQHSKRGTQIGGLFQLEHRHVLLIVIVHQIGLLFAVLVKDGIELAAYNALIPAQMNDGKWWAHYTPMNGIRTPAPEQCKMHMNCCVASGPRGLFLLPKIAYMTSPNSITVNFYERSFAKLPVKDGEVKLELTGGNMLDGNVAGNGELLQLNADREEHNARHVRDDRGDQDGRAEQSPDQIQFANDRKHDAHGVGGEKRRIQQLPRKIVRLEVRIYKQTYYRYNKTPCYVTA